MSKNALHSTVDLSTINPNIIIGKQDISEVCQWYNEQLQDGIKEVSTQPFYYFHINSFNETKTRTENALLSQMYQNKQGQTMLHTINLFSCPLWKSVRIFVI